VQPFLRSLLVATLTLSVCLQCASFGQQGDAKHGILTAGMLRQIHDPTVIYDVNFLRLYPAAMSNKRVMQYFIGLNNCNDDGIERAMLNELDYPALADWYGSNAPRILAALPSALSDIAYRRGTVLALGEYDAQQKSFPFRFPGRNAVDLPDGLSFESNRVSLRSACPVAASAAARAAGELPFQYRVAIQPASFTELRMPQADARKYIESVGAHTRNVFLSLDVRILGADPAFTSLRGAVSQAAFNAEIARLRVIDARTHQPLGTLIDDNSVPDSNAAAPPEAKPPKADPTAGLAGDDRMYEIRAVVFVAIAAKACKWPLSPGQSANAQSFLDRKASSTYFYDRYQYNLATANVRKRVTANGRDDFCSNPAERAEFNKIAAKIAPLGSFAAPVK
jgi:hypothetical protein